MKLRDIAYGEVRAAGAAITSAIRTLTGNGAFGAEPEITEAEREAIERQLLVASKELLRARAMIEEAKGHATKTGRAA